MVEAVGLIGAALREPSAEERFRLLDRANELLLDIIERHPSTALAVGWSANCARASSLSRDGVVGLPAPSGKTEGAARDWTRRTPDEDRRSPAEGLRDKGHPICCGAVLFLFRAVIVARSVLRCPRNGNLGRGPVGDSRRCWCQSSARDIGATCRR